MSQTNNPNRPSLSIPLRGAANSSQSRPSASRPQLNPDKAYAPDNMGVLAHQNIISKWMYEEHDERELRYVDGLLRRQRTKQQAFQHWLAAGKAVRLGELDFALHEHVLGRLLSETRMDSMTTKELVEVGKFVSSVIKNDLEYHDKVLHSSSQEIPSLIEQGADAETVFANDSEEVVEAMTEFEQLDTLERERIRNVFALLVNELEETTSEETGDVQSQT